MTAHDINIITTSLLTLLVLAIAAVWVEPTFADWVIRTLYAHATGVRARRKAYTDAYKKAMQEFVQAPVESSVGSGD